MKRVYESGHAKRLKKARVEKLTNSLAGSLDKFIVKKNSENVINEGLPNQGSANEDVIEEHGSRVEEHINEELVNDEFQIENENTSKEVENLINEELGKESDNAQFEDVYDPGNFKEIDQSLRDLLVERGPIRILKDGDFQFPKSGKRNRRFRNRFYTRFLANGDKQDRLWLVYSTALNKVFCFCCKLFKTHQMLTGFAEDGIDDWVNLGAKLEKHENSKEHIVNMSEWIELKTRLERHETIDKQLQEQVEKDREHWEKILVRIITVVKTLACNNLAFRGDKEKIYEPKNGLFCKLIQMVAEFDPVMKDHLGRVQRKEIRLHFLIHKI